MLKIWTVLPLKHPSCSVYTLWRCEVRAVVQAMPGVALSFACIFGVLSSTEVIVCTVLDPAVADWRC